MLPETTEKSGVPVMGDNTAILNSSSTTPPAGSDTVTVTAKLPSVVGGA
ncbi:MAG: hypothetical protein GDA56_12750 [Hormoscilla sp. GM7CHS1pb]|nr:hypothetical protein [Hormoscilla sp. GM7CHS1pb]